jgi:hypothetical protein
VYIEVEATADTDKIVGNYTVNVVPSTIEPCSTSSYSISIITAPECTYADPVLYWEWVLE